MVEWRSQIADAIPTLYWRPDEWLTEGAFRFRVDVFLPHPVYPSVGRVAFFLVDACRGKNRQCWGWIGDGLIVRKSSQGHGCNGRVLDISHPDLNEIALSNMKMLKTLDLLTT